MLDDLVKLKVKVKQGVKLTDYEKDILITQLNRLISIHNKPIRKKPPKASKPKPKKKLVKVKRSALIKRGEELSKKLTESATKQEKKLRSALNKEGIIHDFQSPIIIHGPKLAIMDFYFPDKNLCVEVDGWHHKKPKNKAEDAKRTKSLATKGIKTIRFWNSEVDNDMHLVIHTIKKALS
jgi:very-short-patch-repair endonuclease